MFCVGLHNLNGVRARHRGVRYVLIKQVPSHKTQKCRMYVLLTALTSRWERTLKTVTNDQAVMAYPHAYKIGSTYKTDFS